MTDTQDNLGPLQPHKKPRKAAKVVLTGLFAAAGIAGDVAFLKYYDWDTRTLDSQSVRFAGAMVPPTYIRAQPQPAKNPSTQPGN